MYRFKSQFQGFLLQVLTPKNFYKPATIRANWMNSSGVGSKLDFIVSESFLDRVNTIDIDASLKLSFMGGLIKISGSAGYLHDGQYNTLLIFIGTL